MANWRDLTLDRAIAKARKNGFSDRDFYGWETMAPEARRQAIRAIIENSGVALIVFRRTFAKALWGSQILTERDDKYDFLNSGVTTEDHEPTGTDYDYPMYFWHLQQMAVAHPELPDQDAWLRYLQENMQ